MRMAVAGRKLSSRSTSRLSARPMMIGPPAPVSSRPTRRRISARMMRSPSSASATSRARSRSGGNDQRFDRSARRGRRPATAVRTAAASSPTNEPAPWLTIAIDAPVLVPPRDDHGAGQDHGQAVAGLTQAPERGALAVASGFAESAQALDLIGEQPGKHLLGPGVDDRRLLRHGRLRSGSVHEGYHAGAGSRVGEAAAAVTSAGSGSGGFALCKNSAVVKMSSVGPMFSRSCSFHSQRPMSHCH